jgi:hypothetical protein
MLNKKISIPEHVYLRLFLYIHPFFLRFNHRIYYSHSLRYLLKLFRIIYLIIDIEDLSIVFDT